MHIDDLINAKFADPLANMVCAALDSGLTEDELRKAMAQAWRDGTYEHRHPDERSPGDDEPRYTHEVKAARRGR